MLDVSILDVSMLDVSDWDVAISDAGLSFLEDWIKLENLKQTQIKSSLVVLLDGWTASLLPC